MNLLEPAVITPEVLRRALSMYLAEVRPGLRPFVFEENDHDLGIDGRFNLSMLGRFVEEAVVLDQVACLKPDCDLDDLERVVRAFYEREHTRDEHARFLAALKTALGMKAHVLQGFIDLIRRQMTQETNERLDAEMRAQRAADRAGREAARALRQESKQSA